MRRSILKTCCLAAAILASACVFPTDPSIVRTLKPALISLQHDSAEVIVPATVLVGEPFEVVVKTFGGGCTTFGETRVNLGRLNADVLPYDYEVTDAPRNFACPDLLKQISHSVTLQFSERGRALIWIFGRGGSSDGTVSIVRAIDVR